MAIWAPQPGFQFDALDARKFCTELFGGGSRYGGKTDWLLADYACDVKWWGKAWKGIIFRRTLNQFPEIIDRSREMYNEMFPGSKFYESRDNLHWRFSNGATLRFFHMERDSDVEKHQGASYTFIGWDELPLFPTGGAYFKMLATLRSPKKGLPPEAGIKRVRSTGNPNGAGLGWIKAYFQIPDDPSDAGGQLITDPASGRTRMFLRSMVQENRIGLDANPEYINTLMAATEGNEQLRQAWLYGNFNVFYGKFFTFFDPAVHCVDPNEVLPGGRIPPHWRLYGSLDYGESAPTSFGLWAVDEEGTSYRIAEYYKAGLWLSEHAGNIKDLIVHCPYTGGRFPERVFADTQIFYTRASANAGAMNRMVADVFRRDAGVNVVPSNKDRIAGWRWLKELLAWKRGDDGRLVVKPKVFYFPECRDFARCMDNAIHAGDEDNPQEDMDTDGEDHACDECRFFVMGAYPARRSSVKTAPSYLTFDYIKQGFGGRRHRKESFIVKNTQQLTMDEALAALPAGR